MNHSGFSLKKINTIERTFKHCKTSIDQNETIKIVSLKTDKCVYGWTSMYCTLQQFANILFSPINQSHLYKSAINE